MLKLNGIHHIAIICSDYEKSKDFYTRILGLKVEQEIYRAERYSYKLDLSLNGQYVVELFSFPDPPERLTRPEAAGLRHLAFAVDNVEMSAESLKKVGVECEPVRVDEWTNKKYSFFYDPDGLPIELYEA